MKETHQTLEGTFVSGELLWLKEQKLPSARLAQSVEHETLNLRVVGSSPTLGAQFCQKKIFQVLPRFELGSQDSES